MQRDILLPHYTAQDYQHWQDDWELINGYPYAMSPSPLPKHQILGSNFIIAFKEELKKQIDNRNYEIFYETDWKISEDTIVRPDIMMVCGTINLNEIITATPVLIVEIFSPATRLKDRNLKFSLYQQCGVKYYLMADPDARTIEPFELANNSYIEMKNGLQFSLNNSCTVTLLPEQIFET
jgi:Uma2 family endonuclease